MSATVPAKPYRWLADHYDRFFGAYAALAETARNRLIGEIIKEARSACDLACGTGTTAISLARKGIRMYGVDFTPAMCRQARAKARRAGVSVDVIRADMREFDLPQAVDLVLCEFDALNHVPRKDDLSAVAGCVARVLKPGGHFYFDVNNRLAFRKVWPATWWSEKPGIALAMHGGFDRERDRGWTIAEWFFREGRLWRRRRERVEQVCWSSVEMRQTLRTAGFDKVRSWDAAPFFGKGSLIVPGCRTFYLARRGRA